MSTMTKNEARQRRKIRIRKKISGTAERPRLVIFRSNLHMYAQVVDDLTGATLAATSTLVLSKGGEKVSCNKAGASAPEGVKKIKAARKFPGAASLRQSGKISELISLRM